VNGKTDQMSLLTLPDMSVNAKIAASMARMVKDSGLSREQVLDRLNDSGRRLGIAFSGGGKLSLATFEKWLNPNEPSYVPRLEELNLFCRIFSDNAPYQVLLDAQGLGARVIDAAETKILEYGRLLLEEKARKARKRSLEAELK
jgi:hypothetical protein